jgi:hypothetical protein
VCERRGVCESERVCEVRGVCESERSEGKGKSE